MCNWKQNNERGMCVCMQVWEHSLQVVTALLIWTETKHPIGNTEVYRNVVELQVPRGLRAMHEICTNDILNRGCGACLKQQLASCCWHASLNRNMNISNSRSVVSCIEYAYTQHSIQVMHRSMHKMEYWKESVVCGLGPKLTSHSLQTV